MRRGNHRAPSKGHSKWLIMMLVVGMFVALAVPAVAAPLPKVDVCHYADGTFHLINISENAFQAHLDHGDASPSEGVPGMPGYYFNDDCSLNLVWTHRETVSMSPDSLSAMGGDYLNSHVSNAITNGYAGSVVFTVYADGTLAADFSFSSLAGSTLYVVYVDTDGDGPYPFTNIGNFTTDTSGGGTFTYSTAPANGTYNWSFYVNESIWSVLKTDSDLAFTIS